MFALSRALELVSRSQTAFSFLFVGKKRSGYARLPWNSHGKARSQNAFPFKVMLQGFNY